MKLQNHKIIGIEFARASNIGAIITPTLVVLHDTAGRLDHGNSANYLRTAPRGVSVHFVIERNGEIQQQVPTNRRAGHAGRSVYHGRKNVNDFSIGIEIVNPGRMTCSGDGKVRTWFKQEFDQSDPGIERASTREHGAGWWMDYRPWPLEGFWSDQRTARSVAYHIRSKRHRNCAIILNRERHSVLVENQIESPVLNLSGWLYLCLIRHAHVLSQL